MKSVENIYIDVSPLLETNWTGIANVIANLCEALLRSGANINCFVFDQILKPPCVNLLLQQKTGAYLSIIFEAGLATEGVLHCRALSENEIGIFTNFKRAGEHFRREVLIVHDLSFVLTPEFHAADRIADYVKRIFCDVKSVDRVVCVSEATKNDVIKYFGVHDSRVTVSHLGVLFNESLRDSDIRAELNRIGLHGDYFLQLGTIEPRKNVDVVLRLIKQFPHWLESYKFVFAGKNGWGRSFEEIKEVHDIKDKQVIHYDYINEYTKECLLRGAKALLFPSWFEGFGLPVIEAMAAGTLVVGSKSSSVVEVGGQAMFGFDPNSPTSLNQALLKVVNLTERERQGAIAAGTRHAAQFTWERFADGVLASARHSGERLRWTRALSPEGGPTRALGSR